MIRMPAFPCGAVLAPSPSFPATGMKTDSLLAPARGVTTAEVFSETRVSCVPTIIAAKESTFGVVVISARLSLDRGLGATWGPPTAGGGATGELVWSTAGKGTALAERDCCTAVLGWLLLASTRRELAELGLPVLMCPEG